MAEIPEFLKSKLLAQYGDEVTNKILDGYSKKRKVTFRINTIKTNFEKIKEELEKEEIDFAVSDFYENAIILNDVDENKIRTLEMYKNGEIYLQSLSSMLPPLILEPREKENILDMTAAPGGKTTQIAMLANNKALITACEKNKIRYDRLAYNVEKQGAKGINLMQEDSRKLSNYFSFDKILLDAPCSGSGTLYSEDENLEKYFTEELISRSAKTQEILLNKALNILKKNGEIVYSTCSILKEENELILKKILKQGKYEIIPINLEKYKALPLLPTIIEGVMCVMPTDLVEGFFVAKIRKI